MLRGKLLPWNLSSSGQAGKCADGSVERIRRRARGDNAAIRPVAEWPRALGSLSTVVRRWCWTERYGKWRWSGREARWWWLAAAAVETSTCRRRWRPSCWLPALWVVSSPSSQSSSAAATAAPPTRVVLAPRSSAKGSYRRGQKLSSNEDLSQTDRVISHAHARWTLPLSPVSVVARRTPPALARSWWRDNKMYYYDRQSIHSPKPNLDLDIFPSLSFPFVLKARIHTCTKVKFKGQSV